MRVLAQALVALALLPAGAAAVEPRDAAPHIVEEANAFRKAEGLAALKTDAALESAAVAFARFMARTGKYGHTADGRRPVERAAAAGYEHCIVAENIAYLYRSQGFGSAERLAREFVEGWKNSPPHRRNLVDGAVTETGVGVARDEQGRYFGVHLFGLPRSAQIRFRVENATGERVRYTLGEQGYTLDARVARTHSICRPARIAVERFGAAVVDGARYVVRPGAVDVR
jgi:hypothetical protein